MTKRTFQKSGGWLLTEMMVTVTLLAIVIGILASLGIAFKKINQQRWHKQTLIAAGQAQMDAIVTTGKPIDAETFARLWPEVDCEIQVSPGQGDWERLQRIRLHLSASHRGKMIEHTQCRYIPADKELAL